MSSAGKLKRIVGKKQEFDKKGWAGFKKGVADYVRRKAIADANRPSRLTVTPIEKGAK